VSCRSYFRYGSKTATGPTYLAIFRDTVKRYPDRDRRQVLLDLIETRGERGKWFAAVKDAGFLDVALLCARDYAAEPATLVRAARDFAAKEPKFAAQIGGIARPSTRDTRYARRTVFLAYGPEGECDIWRECSRALKQGAWVVASADVEGRARRGGRSL
jgi:hypothetical protein